MSRFLQIMARPGARGTIHGVAPIQSRGLDSKEGETIVDATEVFDGYTPRAKAGRLNRWLDRVVRLSGSQAVFLFVVICLLTWAFLGIPFGQDENWQVLISDVQAIVSYIFDSFLMRQQLNSYDESLIVSVEMRSHIASHKRMLVALTQNGVLRKEMLNGDSRNAGTEIEARLPPENLVGRLTTHIAWVVGHIVTVSMYWVCIFIWIGFGHYCGWSNEWQLYINSATSALMVFIFAFLANIRERHARYVNTCLDSIYQADCAIEAKLRLATGDNASNETIIIPAPKVNVVQRVINYYADVVGTLVGIVLLFAVLVAWVSIGPALQFSSNWWLLIGTYAGLVGMNDGFVLRNIDGNLKGYEEAQFSEIERSDAALFEAIGVPQTSEKLVQKDSTTHRISTKMGRICASEYMVVAGFLTIVGLITISSVLKWSLTGQLICNVPPSVIESFFMIILITGHNISDGKRRQDLQNLYTRRLRLATIVDSLEPSPVQSIEF
ncbi:hypothetical protein MBLNU459_g2840t4 [Dothideomycetes sp. NU459]